MKKFLLLTFFINVSIGFSQEKTIVLTHADTQNPEFFQTIGNSTNVTKYTASDGSILSVGDTLVIGIPSGGSSSTKLYGASLKTKSASSFTTITLGRPAGFGNVMLAMNGDAPATAGPDMIGQIVKVVEMNAYHKGSRKKPLAISIILGDTNGRAFGINKHLSVIDYENSMVLGELKSKNAPMTSDEALIELKKAKDKLDLELITLEEYNAIKQKLKAFIR